MKHHLCAPRLGSCHYSVLLGLFLILPIYSQAQTLDLYTAVNKALTNYPLIQQREAEVAAGKAHITTVNGNRLPSLTLMDELNSGTSNSLAGPYFSLGVIPSVSGSIREENNDNMASGNIAISYLNWPFYTFGYYNAATRTAKAQLATSQALLNSDKYLLANSIISLYLDWLKKYRIMLIEQENVNRAATIFTAIKATVNSGLKPGVDSSTASAEYARDRIAYIQAVNNYNYDQLSLAAYIGLDTTQIQPDTTIFSTAFQDTVMQFQPIDSISQSHPLLDVYQKQYEQQLASNHEIAKYYLPKLSLQGAGWARSSSIAPTDSYNPAFMGLDNSRYNYLFGLTLSYNIFNLKHRHDQLVEGKYDAQAAQQQLQTQQLTLNKMLQQANTSYSSAEQKLQELPIELRAAQEAYHQQLALYRGGLNTLIDVTNALYVLRQTETDVVVAQDELLQLLYLRAGLSNQLDTFLQHFKQ